MILIPNGVLLRYISHLKSRWIDAARNYEYMKWLGWYFCFCDNYPVLEELLERVWLFIDKPLARKLSESKPKSAAGLFF